MFSIDSKTVQKQVALILQKVEKEGDRAVRFFVRKYDKTNLSPGQFLVPEKKIRESLQKISPSVRSALLIAKKRIENFHKAELKQIKRSWNVTIGGISVGQVSHPISRVGIYVPGGRYSYPSTVLMTAIPARVAGVEEIVMVTPPNNLKDEILAAASICGVDIVFKVGGPAAIAALAYGTRTIPKVDKIVGPGNQYVTEAKRQIFGIAGIDGLAGPSEVVIWADSSAAPSKIILNLLAQAEHDPQSRSILFCGDEEILSEVKKSIPKKFAGQVIMRHERNERKIVEEINKIAPEHLYLALNRAKRFLPKIRNAGAIFLGEESPVALGDYVAGPSHVLPTGASAKFSSGLSVKDFLKWSSVTENRSGKKSSIFKAAKTLSEVEGLYYHALSLK